jgi:hypothetical protein
MSDTLKTARQAVAALGPTRLAFARHDVDRSFLPEVLARGGVKFSGVREDASLLEELFPRLTRDQTP